MSAAFLKLLSYFLNYSSHKGGFEISPTGAPRRNGNQIVSLCSCLLERARLLPTSPNLSVSVQVLASREERGPESLPQGSLQEGWLLRFQTSCLGQQQLQHPLGEVVCNVCPVNS